MNHCLMGNYSSVNFEMLQKTQDNLGKLANKLKLETAFNMDWKGHTFNIVPFLCTGLTYFYWDDTEFNDYKAMVVSFIRKDTNAEQVREDMIEGMFETLKTNLPTKDFQLFDCLPKHQDPYRNSAAAVCYYIYLRDPKLFLRTMLQIQASLLRELVMEQRAFDSWSTLNYKELGNVEAFCFYIGLKWLVTVEPQYKMWLGKFLRKLELTKKYEEFCPEGSFVDRVLKDEIEPDKIVEYFRGRRFLDGSSLYYRTLVQSATEGDYDGHDLSKEMRHVLNQHVDWVKKPYVNAECELYDAYVMREKGKVVYETKKLQHELNSTKENIKKNQRSLSKKDALITEYQDTIKQLQEEVETLRFKVKNQSTDEELKGKVTQYEEEIKDLKAENAYYDKIHLRDKQEISSLRKKVGKEVAKTISDNLDNYENETVTENTVTLEDKIELLKDKTIVLIGAEFLETTRQKIEDMGIPNIELCCKDTATPGKFDIGVVLTTRCMHDVVRRMETFADKYGAKWLHSPSVNADLIINLTYENIIEDERSAENILIV